ncbi:TrkA family potassium uptake protein [Streptomyces thermoalcalitolerans]|uniref:Trk system potassium uptake protein TrkA n=1 Tax=Streptomyces thermoalcalitolerans TaxID=65605 RepID=A0ABP3YX87_9ACTN
MKVLIAGAGRLGTQIAQVLSAAHNDVTLVEYDDGRVAELEDLARVRLAHVRLLAGDACEPDLLERAGAFASDLVVAVTGRDEDNLVISLLAKRRFGVERVAARVNEAENAWLFDQRWGVDVAVPAATPLISLIEEATGATDTVALLRLSRAGVEVIETAITERSRAAGRALGEITLPAGTVVATVVRGGRPTVPGPGLRLLPGDELLLVSHEATEQEIHAAFQ